MATFEVNLTEAQEVNQTLVLGVKLTTAASVQPYSEQNLTVVLTSTAVDNSNKENFSSTSVSSELLTAQLAITMQMSAGGIV